MTPIVLWVALAWGVDAGYEPAPDGHLEYIIQIEPQLLGSLAAGHDVTSEVPRGLDVRHYRISVGTAALPRIAPPAAGRRPSIASGASARAADQFEAPGRVDEAIGATTPQVRVGYQAISATGGQYVIEIDSRSLADLNQADLTGDIPPGLPVTRFVVSTNPGTVPGETPNLGGHAPMASTTAAVPAVIDEDPSSWQAEPSAAAAGSPSGSGGLPPSAASEPQIPDDAPGGAVAPPAAMPPRNETEEHSSGAPSGPATSSPTYLDPQRGTFHQHDSSADRTSDSGHGSAHDSATDSSPATGAPGHLPFATASGPLVTTTAGIDEAEPESQKKHSSATVAEGDENTTSRRRSESKEAAPTKPWLPFTLALLALFASLGGNVFLGWIAWESYTRRSVIDDKIAGGKPSLSS